MPVLQPQPPARVAVARRVCHAAQQIAQHAARNVQHAACGTKHAAGTCRVGHAAHIISRSDCAKSPRPHERGSRHHMHLHSTATSHMVFRVREAVGFGLAAQQGIPAGPSCAVLRVLQATRVPANGVLQVAVLDQSRALVASPHELEVLDLAVSASLSLRVHASARYGFEHGMLYSTSRGIEPLPSAQHPRKPALSTQQRCGTLNPSTTVLLEVLHQPHFGVVRHHRVEPYLSARRRRLRLH